MTTIFQASRDIIPVVHVTIQDSEIHHLEKLQVVLHNCPAYPVGSFTDIPLYLLIPGKYSAVLLFLLIPGR